MPFKSVLACLAASRLVVGYGAIVKAVGDQGGNGTALGIDASIPRDGSNRNPFQQDSTHFKNAAADQCGETLGGGTNDPATQVNGDGAGPYECMIDSTGMGTQWSQMQVATNPLTAKVAADQTCTGSMGGQEGICMVRCNNAVNAGPIGGCVPVQMASSAGNTTAAPAAKPARSFNT
ncbi:hypothetical protein BDZ45DRAFT_798791 [Acephala macrosclerotiorum]|nr:hypothetical protein BDZ45DRAFT_798791 [Acephala macrosclerotiorum]